MLNRNRPSGGDLLAVVAGVRSHFDEFESSKTQKVASTKNNRRKFASFPRMILIYKRYTNVTLIQLMCVS